MGKLNNTFNDTDDCKLFVTSDLHLNHKQQFLWEPRGYKSREEHNDGVIEIINQTCRPQDILLNLGDVCLNTNERELRGLISRIKCKQWWLKGNHNNPWEKQFQTTCRTDMEYASFGENDYEIINYHLFPDLDIIVKGTSLELLWNKQMVVFNHYPYLVWNQMHHGCWSCCGHSHGSCQLTLPDNLTWKQLDCGWDVHSKPLEFKGLKSIMDKKKIQQNDHHDKHVN